METADDGNRISLWQRPRLGRNNRALPRIDPRRAPAHRESRDLGGHVATCEPGGDCVGRASCGGIARTLTDFSCVAYLSDLAVRASHQRRGIGVEMIRKTREKLGPRSMLVLLAAPKAVDYYPKVGFTRHESAWVLRAGDKLEARG